MFSSQNSQVSNDANWIEECFQTHLYTGNGSTQTINNGIDLSTKGGMVWLKQRNDSVGHRLYDTARGATKLLESNGTAAQSTSSTGLTSFGTTGFSLGNDPDTNTNAGTYASWTFRKQKKFFDVVTWTGNGTAGRAISHSLGSVPGFIVVKSTTTSPSNWLVLHRNDGTTWKQGFLNTTDALSDGYGTIWGSGGATFTAPTSTTFTINDCSGTAGTAYSPNTSGEQYVGYVFAHNAGGFGLTGTDNVISCGSYTGTGVAGNSITLDYEPQFIIVKAASTTGNWTMYDNMRGISQTSSPRLSPNTSDAEVNASFLKLTATGFTTETSPLVNASGQTYIYIAIRRGPMKVPTDATKVFAVNTAGAVSPAPPLWNSGFVTDFALHRIVNTLNSTRAVSRLTGEGELFTNLTNAEGTDVDLHWDYMKGFWNGSSVNTSQYAWMFQRAPSFFDEVCYTGNYTGGGTLYQTLNHNLGKVPELMIVKMRSSAKVWAVYYGDTSKYIELQSTAAAQAADGRWYSTSPTSTQFTVGNDSDTNLLGEKFVNYLFATCAGVQYINSYVGDGTTGRTINCGFTGGARFVCIKATSTTGSWWTFDSARGIVTNNDPALQLNSTAAEVTSADAIDTASSGFIVNQEATCSLNASGVTYLVWAIA